MYFITKAHKVIILVLIIIISIIVLVFQIDFSNKKTTTYEVITRENLNRIDLKTKQEIPWGVISLNIKPDIKSDINQLNRKIVKVAILDSGIDKNHEDLKQSKIIEFNAEGPNKPVFDILGHGTAIAGIIASNDNDFGIVGVSPDVELYSVKILDDSGKGDINDFVKGIEWCIENNVDIINLSFGIKRENQHLESVIEKAINEGIIIVAAAGNNYGISVDYPAAYEDVFSITAIDSSSHSLNSSAVGKIDFSAPGKDILTLSPNNQYAVYDGTSFASAYVTGLIAKLLKRSEYPKDLNLISLIRKDLIAISKDLGSKGYDEVYGYGSLSF
ncbi:S8 family serine peptidase [Paenibacillus sp. URB8-2]|uniref:S8 family serine peptidase n=1 Tax=Paenibacillus sp. URB8-2 TaxID=2741301 RepID=UPI0015C2C17B|nr:S8 family serine peptidase [Paenibacillus sp. URB8-2]BCG60072.1 hypothetical protein PUR_34970 [Paenibacillus sp. URB8-2]